MNKIYFEKAIHQSVVTWKETQAFKDIFILFKDLLAVYLVMLTLYNLQKESDNQYYRFSNFKHVAHFFTV